MAVESSKMAVDLNTEFATLHEFKTYTPIGSTSYRRVVRDNRFYRQSSKSASTIELMTDSQIQFSDQPLPSCEQLDKIVQSLGLLIEMQNERDARQTSAFETITSRLDLLQGTVTQLAADRQDQTSTVSDVDDSLVKSICAKYGLGTEDELSLNDAGTDSDDADLATDSKAVETEATVDDGNKDEQVGKVDELSVREIPPMDLEEINAIKQQLHEKLREAELELSVRRANLSQREAVLEEKEARLQQEIQRKMILSSDIRWGPQRQHDAQPTKSSFARIHRRQNRQVQPEQ